MKTEYYVLLGVISFLIILICILRYLQKRDERLQEKAAMKERLSKMTPEQIQAELYEQITMLTMY